MARECGPGKGLLSKVIPDRIIGLDLSKACHVHDIDYNNKRVSRFTADMRFLENMLKEVKTNNEIKRAAQVMIIYFYTFIVRIFGWGFKKK